MCVRDDGKYYTDDSTYSDDGRDFTKNMDGHRLPGNTIDKVIVEGRLFVYLKTFEKFIQVNKHIEFINLARTGVKIEGVPYMTYEDAIATINPDISSSTFDQKVTTLLENQLEVSDLTECFRGINHPCEKTLPSIP